MQTLNAKCLHDLEVTQAHQGVALCFLGKTIVEANSTIEFCPDVPKSLLGHLGMSLFLEFLPSSSNFNLHPPTIGLRDLSTLSFTLCTVFFVQDRV